MDLVSWNILHIKKTQLRLIESLFNYFFAKLQDKNKMIL